MSKLYINLKEVNKVNQQAHSSMLESNSENFSPEFRAQQNKQSFFPLNQRVTKTATYDRVQANEKLLQENELDRHHTVSIQSLKIFTSLLSI